MDKKRVIIVAGGTAGHINAAISLGDWFNNKFEPLFITGTRYLDYKLFNEMNVKHFDGKTIRGKNPLFLLKSFILNSFVFLKIFLLFIKKRPQFIIGAGGYICGPTMLAGWVLRIPLFLIEQNAIAGMTNKILARFSKKIFVNFENTKGFESYVNKVEYVGNPVKPSINFYKNELIANEVNILIFGGSLGATQLDPIARELSKNSNYKILHQVGKGNTTSFKSHNYKQQEYIDNMNEAYKWANIIIARSGASTVSEIELIQKPSLLVPYPLATDNHQYENAKNLKAKNICHIEILDSKDENLVEMASVAIEKIVKNKLFHPFKEYQIKNTNELIEKSIRSFL